MSRKKEKYIEYVANDIFGKLNFRWNDNISVHYVDFPTVGSWSMSQLRFPDYFPQAFFEEGSQWVTYLSYNYGVRPSESKLIWDEIIKLLKKKFPYYWR